MSTVETKPDKQVVVLPPATVGLNWKSIIAIAIVFVVAQLAPKVVPSIDDAPPVVIKTTIDDVTPLVVYPDDSITLQIERPGKLAVCEVDAKVVDPVWTFDPPTIERDFAEANHKCYLETTETGARYIVFAAGMLDGKTYSQKWVVTVGEYVPTKPITVSPTDPPKPIVDPSTKVTAAVYVYEKDDRQGVPPVVMATLNKLNREHNILATLFEDDSTDGGGDVPEQYKVPHAAASAKGLPALVLLADGKEVRTLPDTKDDPLTEEKILEAVR